MPSIGLFTDSRKPSPRGDVGGRGGGDHLGFDDPSLRAILSGGGVGGVGAAAEGSKDTGGATKGSEEDTAAGG